MVFSAAGSGAFASLCRLLSVFLLVCAQPSVGDVGGGFAPKFITATTPGRLQDAISAGVQHVLITGHMDMTKSPLERDMDSQVQALNGGIGRLKETTRSIGVRLQLSWEAMRFLCQQGDVGAHTVSLSTHEMENAWTATH